MTINRSRCFAVCLVLTVKRFAASAVLSGTTLLALRPCGRSLSGSRPYVVGTRTEL